MRKCLETQSATARSSPSRRKNIGDAFPLGTAKIARANVLNDTAHARFLVYGSGPKLSVRWVNRHAVAEPDKTAFDRPQIT